MDVYNNNIMAILQAFGVCLTGMFVNSGFRYTEVPLYFAVSYTLCMLMSSPDL